MGRYPHSFFDPGHTGSGIGYIIDNDKTVETDSHATEDTAWLTFSRCAHRDIAFDHHHCGDTLTFMSEDFSLIDDDSYFSTTRHACVVDTKAMSIFVVRACGHELSLPCLR